jgi:hypothetical protein
MPEEVPTPGSPPWSAWMVWGPNGIEAEIAER